MYNIINVYKDMNEGGSNTISWCELDPIVVEEEFKQYAKEGEIVQVESTEESPITFICDRGLFESELTRIKNEYNISDGNDINVEEEVIETIGEFVDEETQEDTPQETEEITEEPTTDEQLIEEVVSESEETGEALI